MRRTLALHDPIASLAWCLLSRLSKKSNYGGVHTPIATYKKYEENRWTSCPSNHPWYFMRLLGTSGLFLFFFFNKMAHPIHSNFRLSLKTWMFSSKDFLCGPNSCQVSLSSRDATKRGGKSVVLRDFGISYKVKRSLTTRWIHQFWLLLFFSAGLQTVVWWKTTNLGAGCFLEWNG